MSYLMKTFKSTLLQSVIFTPKVLGNIVCTIMCNGYGTAFCVAILSSTTKQQHIQEHQLKEEVENMCNVFNVVLML